MAISVRLNNVFTIHRSKLITHGSFNLIVRDVNPLSVYKDYKLIQKRYCRSNLTNVFETTKTITMEQVKYFAELTNDSNPIHLKQSSQSTQKPIVHGALLMSIVAGVMGSHFPGPGSIVISQEMKFLEPCPVDTIVNILVGMISNDTANSKPRRRKISDCYFSCTDAQNNSICYMKGTAKLRIKS